MSGSQLSRYGSRRRLKSPAVREERGVLNRQSDVTGFNDESLPQRAEVARRCSLMWSTDRTDNSALADGLQREDFAAHGISGLNDRLTDNHGNAHTK